MRPAGPPLVADRAADLLPWVAAQVLGAAEIHAAEVVLRADQTATAPVQLGAALALWAPLHGHVCFDLACAAELVEAELAGPDAGDGQRPAPLPWPASEEWLSALRDSSLVRVVDRHDARAVLDGHPLVLHGTRLYVQRQWIDECSVAAQLKMRAAMPVAPVGDAGSAVITELWPLTGDVADDAQRAAAEIATRHALSAVVGGPGSGKTHTVAGILAALLADADARDASCSIAMAAPTGKAAQRMRDSVAAAVRQARETAVLSEPVADRLGGVDATTLHRLLGPLPVIRTRFRHDAANPLPHDVVVVDETSMIALPMMARLLEALRPDARLILLGDPDQLESIEAGAVLGDFVAAAADPAGVLSRHVARLGRSRRQGTSSPIVPLGDAIRDGRVDEVLARLREGAADAAGGSTLTFVETSDPLAAATLARVRPFLAPSLAAALEAALSARTRAALAATATTRVLCAHRRGPWGVDGWNELAERWMLGAPAGRRMFAGRALLVVRNDLRNGLTNGDSGVVVSSDVGLVAAFEVGGELRTFAPAQLESVEAAFATTVHKSQGSEYDTVVLVLPPASSPLARRELLYTAVTRTSRRLVVVGTAESVVTAVRTPRRRATGLVAALDGG